MSPSPDCARKLGERELRGAIYKGEKDRTAPRVGDQALVSRRSTNGPREALRMLLKTPNVVRIGGGLRFTRTIVQLRKKNRNVGPETLVETLFNITFSE